MRAHRSAGCARVPCCRACGATVSGSEASDIAIRTAASVAQWIFVTVGRTMGMDRVGW